jgi:sugar phosphate isomerase/epimerase
MQVSISSWSYRKWFEGKKCDLSSFVDEVKRQGADGLEIFPQHVNQNDPGGHLKEVAARAKMLGLSISAVIAGNEFGRPAAKDRAAQVERMKQWIVYTAEAGVSCMNTFTGSHAPGQDPFMETWRVIDSYREVMPVAEQNKVLLCIENHSSICPDADGLLWIIKAVGSPNLRTNPDPTNFVPDFAVRSEGARERVYTETEKFAQLMSNAHLKIAEFTPAGDHAHVNVPRLLDIFRKAGYDGHLVLEYYGQGDPAEPCAKGVALLRRLLR